MKVLYTGFKGKNNSSCQLLAKISGQKMFLTNSFDGLKKDIMNVTDRYDFMKFLKISRVFPKLGKDLIWRRIKYL